MKTIFSPSRRFVLALAVLLFTVAGCASSQETLREDDRVAQRVAAIDEAVDLTDTQQVRIREILEAAEANRPSGPPPRSGQGSGNGRRTGGDDPRAEIERRIEAVLTDAQLERYRTWRATQAQQRERRTQRG